MINMKFRTWIGTVYSKSFREKVAVRSAIPYIQAKPETYLPKIGPEYSNPEAARAAAAASASEKTTAAAQKRLDLIWRIGKIIIVIAIIIIILYVLYRFVKKRGGIKGIPIVNRLF